VRGDGKQEVKEKGKTNKQISRKKQSKEKSFEDINRRRLCTNQQ
jgi:hypothetical protein